MMRRRGIGTELRIGARKDNECFEAHAWVEIDGAVLNDTEDVDNRFSPFPSPATKGNQ